MNTKEIASAVNKDERSVRRWVKKAADKMSVIADKMSVSTSTHPADFDLDETLLIIETGLGKNAAAVYASNAKDLQKPSNSLLSQKEIEMITKIVAVTVSSASSNRSSVTGSV